MMHLPFRYLSYSRQGAMLTRVQNLFSLSNFFIHFYTVVFMDLVLIIGIIVALFIFSVEIGIVVFIVLLIISLVVIKGMKRINAVSYTHLDVYKRQILSIIIKKSDNSPQTE